jgi:hypothetical protein
MLIRRCAWHREFHGYSALHGIASWGGLSVKFTDGVCRRCAARVRAEWHVVRSEGDARSGPGLLVSGYRRVALLAGLAALVAAVVPTAPLTDTFQDAEPGRAAEATDPRGVTPSEALAGVEPGQEVTRPRVSSRHRRSAPRGPAVIRYRPPGSRIPEHTAAMVASAPPARPIEVKRPDPPRPPVPSAAPLPGVARIRATEDELMRVAHRHSVARLSLAPPEERPRHAGLAVQTP